MLFCEDRRLALAKVGMFAMVWLLASGGSGASDPGRNPEFRTATFYVA